MLENVAVSEEKTVCLVLYCLIRLQKKLGGHAKLDLRHLLQLDSSVRTGLANCFSHMFSVDMTNPDFILSSGGKP